MRLQDVMRKSIHESDRLNAICDSVRAGVFYAPDIDPFSIKVVKAYNQDIPEIENVIFNDPATIVFWSDGTKTVVKTKNENFDREKGLAMAIAKKAFGNKGNYYNHIKKWIKRGD